MGKLSSDKNNRLIASYKRARHDYVVEETFDAGLVLLGSEVKALREGRVTLRDGFVEIRKGEAWLVNISIQEYAYANRQNHPPTRPRKLLLKATEIRRIARRIDEKGYSGFALDLRLVRGKMKVTIGLGRGQTKGDKRQSIKAKDAKREMQRALKH